MSLEVRVNALATAVGNDVQALIASQGVLANLNTTAQDSLVNAINEVLAAVGGAGSGDLLSTNNLSDLVNAATARTNLDVRSTSQVTNEIAAAITGVTLAGLGGLDQAAVDSRVQLLVDSAPAALDTLNEISAAIGDDANFAATIASSLGERVRFDAAQTKTVVEQAQACANIGVGNPEADFLGTYTTARDS